MPERDSYDPGTPSWVDLGSPDVDASIKFYGELLGWEAQESQPDTGGYRIFTKNGSPVAGVMALQSEEQPPAWSTYIAVEDADAAVGKAKEAGGEVIVEPMDVTEIGRMAFFTDDQGAAIGVWQAKEFAGAGLVNEPGALAWNELATKDPAKAKDFYSAVFGWEGEDQEMGEGMTYTTLKVGDSMVAGMMKMDEENFPPETPPHWLVYFAVEDCDAAAEKVKELDGTVVAGPVDIEGVGRFAVAAEPSRAMFAVIALESQDDGESDDDDSEEDGD